MSSLESSSENSFWQDLKVLRHLVFSRPRGGTHAQRIESFYSGQAYLYDSFRERLLSGRENLIKSCVPQGFPGTWIDFGAGTGSNLEYAINRLGANSRVTLVDICPSLLKVAAERVKRHGLNNVQICQADAATFTHSGLKADLVTFSYSLTMMPNWQASLRNALGLLASQGRLGVVDFGFGSHADLLAINRLDRFFWKTWFSYDSVNFNPEHLDFLLQNTKPVKNERWRAKLPYLPVLKAPSYLYIGQSE